VSFSTSIRKIVHLGWQRYCPACESHTRRFGAYGVKPRPDARCLVCNSSERERAQVLAIRRGLLPRFAGKAPVRILHLAPEPGVARALRAIPGARYVSGDIEPGRAMRVVDLTQLDDADGSVDLLFVSHVLEHIEDDGRAMAEMRRVLAPGGVAWVEVPVLRHKTLEDFSIRDPQARLLAFGQSDHVRVCGADYADRLAAAGFQVESLTLADQFTAEEIAKSRLLLELTPQQKAEMPSWYEEYLGVAWLCTV
jgi:SAM-dependent methyltransferase